ncbi:hypothetical protein [Dehalobacter restrictus]|uniref:Large polyvalent protein associated domain-containing protein n=1 Tax=Dehalobacter restrictus TaxID=55583 RepID=A0A857DG10_9FIRM|nr:hypothetical protein [Dehalobacter restrictus]QGZ99441.1 hypothetical protein GQ588_01545 [Dehalobacter restrictus]
MTSSDQILANLKKKSSVSTSSNTQTSSDQMLKQLQNKGSTEKIASTFPFSITSQEQQISAPASKTQSFTKIPSINTFTPKTEREKAYEAMKSNNTLQNRMAYAKTVTSEADKATAQSKAAGTLAEGSIAKSMQDKTLNDAANAKNPLQKFLAREQATRNEILTSTTMQKPDTKLALLADLLGTVEGFAAGGKGSGASAGSMLYKGAETAAEKTLPLAANLVSKASPKAANLLLNPLAKTAITQGAAGAGYETATSLANNEKMSGKDIALAAGTNALLPLAGKVVGKGLGKIEDIKINKQVEKSIPKIQSNPITDIQNAYKNANVSEYLTPAQIEEAKRASEYKNIFNQEKPATPAYLLNKTQSTPSTLGEVINNVTGVKTPLTAVEKGRVLNDLQRTFAKERPVFNTRQPSSEVNQIKTGLGHPQGETSVTSITPENAKVIAERLSGGNSVSSLNPLGKEKIKYADAKIEQPTVVKNSNLSEGSTITASMHNGKLFTDPIISDGMKESGTGVNNRTDLGNPQSISDELTSNPLEYKEITNKETLAKAQTIYNQGQEKARTELTKLINELKPEAAPLAKMLARDKAKAGDAEGAREILSELSVKMVQSGQFGQAGRILRQSDPQSIMLTLEKQINSLNKEGLESYGKRWTNVELTPIEQELINKIDIGDEDAITSALEQIHKRIANELPATFLEKATAFRHSAMLLNIRTNLRNVGGNSIMLVMRKSSQALSGAIQKAALKEADRTQVIYVDKEYKLLAKDYLSANEKSILQDSNNKYLETIKLDMPDKRVFSKSRIANQLGVTEKKISLSLPKGKKVTVDLVDLPEETRKFTYKLLELGDTPFFKNAYIDRLASYAQAKGTKDFSKLPNDAFETAFKEAMESTYKDASKLATYLNSIKNPGGNVSGFAKLGGAAIDAVLPFTKTPINIIRRGIQYSPAGIINGLSQGGVKSAKALDEIAKGLTGTSIAALGYILASKGILTGKASDDADLKAYDKATGNAPFSILGKYSYDWAQPFAIPLVIGVEMYNSIKENQDEVAKMDSIALSNDENTFAKFVKVMSNGLIDGFKASGDTILDMSLMQGIQNIVGNQQGIMEGATQIIPNYVSQFVPTLLSQTAKTIDPAVRQTYIKGDKLGSAAANIQSKIPFVSKSLEAKQTPYGEDMTRVNNGLLRGLTEFASPGTITKVQNGDTKVDTEIRRLADLGYKKQIPTVVPNYIEGTKRHPKLELTPEEVTQYQKRTGEITLAYFQKEIKSDRYIHATEAIKEEILADEISRAKAIAKAEIVKSKGY